MAVNEDQVSSILVAIAGLSGRMDSLGTRLDGMETARSVARVEQDSWKTEIRSELSDIKAQTTMTNGRLKEIELWRARMNGIATVFAWWKPAVATLAASGVIYIIVSLATR